MQYLTIRIDDSIFSESIAILIERTLNEYYQKGYRLHSTVPDTKGQGKLDGVYLILERM
jgi:hypothetical protein